MARNMPTAAARSGARKNTRPTQQMKKVRRICHARQRGFSALIPRRRFVATKAGSKSALDISTAAWNRPHTTNFQSAPCQMPVTIHTTNIGKQVAKRSAARGLPLSRRRFLTRRISPEADTGKYT